MSGQAAHMLLVSQSKNQGVIHAEEEPTSKLIYIVKGQFLQL
jgi:hypothetical protein